MLALFGISLSVFYDKRFKVVELKRQNSPVEGIKSNSVSPVTSDVIAGK